jgi:hypothetical protein
MEMSSFDDGGIVWDGSGDVSTMNNLNFPPSTTDTFSSIGLDPALWVGAFVAPARVFDYTVTVHKFGAIVSVASGTCDPCSTLKDTFAAFGVDTDTRGMARHGGGGSLDFDLPVVLHTALFQGVPVTAAGGDRVEFGLSAADQAVLLGLLSAYHPDDLRIGLLVDTSSVVPGGQFMPIVFSLSGAQADPGAAVPEPASLFLLASGLACAATRRYRRRTRTARS